MSTEGSPVEDGPSARGVAVLTLGHGTLPADAFGDLLVAAGVDVLVDVRRYPGSRRHPHFAAAVMPEWLADHGVDYRPMTDLGGRRRPEAGTTNAGWRNPQFRAYADYMATAEFRVALSELVGVAAVGTVAAMCSESVWWRCHRRLLADHLEVIDGIAVEHLFHDGRRTRHPPTPGHRVEGGRLVYPAVPPDG